LRGLIGTDPFHQHSGGPFRGDPPPLPEVDLSGKDPGGLTPPEMGLLLPRICASVALAGQRDVSNGPLPIGPIHVFVSGGVYDRRLSFAAHNAPAGPLAYEGYGVRAHQRESPSQVPAYSDFSFVLPYEQNHTGDVTFEGVRSTGHRYSPKRMLRNFRLLRSDHLLGRS